MSIMETMCCNKVVCEVGLILYLLNARITNNMGGVIFKSVVSELVAVFIVDVVQAILSYAVGHMNGHLMSMMYLYQNRMRRRRPFRMLR